MTPSPPSHLLRDGQQRSLEACLDAERESFLALAGTADFAEGVRAFAARRPPRFGQSRS